MNHSEKNIKSHLDEICTIDTTLYDSAYIFTFSNCSELCFEISREIQNYGFYGNISITKDGLLSSFIKAYNYEERRICEAKVLFDEATQSFTVEKSDNNKEIELLIKSIPTIVQKLLSDSSYRTDLFETMRR